MLRTALRLAAFACCLVATGHASAMSVHTFDFRTGSTHAQWEGLGPITIEQVPDGLLLATGNGTGAILTDAQLPWLPQAGRLLAASPAGAEIKFVWAFLDEADSATFSAAIDVAIDTLDTTSVDLSSISSWRHGNKRIGLALPPQTTVLVSRLEFARWNIVEQFVETSASFWRMDQYRPYSINFIWGPRLASNPVARQLMYRDVPPKAPSTTYILLCGLVLVILTALLYARGSPQRRQRAFVLIVGSIAAVWLLLDARMGLEYLSWIAHDHATYNTGTIPERTFRDRDNFYDFAAFAAPLVADRQSYLFFAEREWPYLGNIRYITYPAIPGGAFDSDDTWVIYRRPEMTTNAEGQLMLRGTAITGPGKMLGQFATGSFVFRAPPLPLAAPKTP